MLGYRRGCGTWHRRHEDFVIPVSLEELAQSTRDRPQGHEDRVRGQRLVVAERFESFPGMVETEESAGKVTLSARGKHREHGLFPFGASKQGADGVAEPGGE
jgi:hypothetical protein